MVDKANATAVFQHKKRYSEATVIKLNHVTISSRFLQSHISRNIFLRISSLFLSLSPAFYLKYIGLE